MTEDQFDICLEFHKGLIRSQHSKQTINDARLVNIHGCGKGDLNASRRSAAGGLLDGLEYRFNFLTDWQNVDNADKIAIYNFNNTRNPSQGAFDAAFDVMANGTGISKAAKDNRVNYQSIKVLIPRLQRWDKFAKRLHETL